MDIDKLITAAKNSYQTNKYRSYRECYNDGVLVLADLIRQQLLRQTDVSGRSEQLICSCSEDEICGICHRSKGYQVIDGKLTKAN